MAMDEELLTRQMPHSVEAEQAVLGSMLIDARCIPVVIEKLRSEDFYLKQNRDIYETIYSMFSLSETVDPVTVLDKMRLNGVFDENTSRAYILQLMEVTPTAANVGEYMDIVKDKSLLRRIAETAGDLTAMVQEGTAAGQEVLDAAEQRIYSIRQGRAAQGLTPLSSVVLDVLDRLEELSKSDSAVPGLSTGLPDVDSAISGLNNSDLILLAARPGMGKTSFALNVLLQVGKFSGKTAVFFSLEMSREQLCMRLISNEAFVDNKKLVTGRLTDEDWDKVALAAAALGRSKILILGGRHERQVPPGGGPGAGGHRLPPAHAVGGRQAEVRRREPPAGGLRHLPGIEDHGQGAQRAGGLPLPALPRTGEPPGQAAHALRPPGVGGHRAGRRHRHVPLPGRLL